MGFVGPHDLSAAARAASPTPATHALVRLAARVSGGLLVALTLVAGSACSEVQARRQIQEGNKLYSQGNYAEAAAEYEAALKAHPELAIGWFNLGLANLAVYTPGEKTPENDARAKAAIDAFRKYAELAPTDPDAEKLFISTLVETGAYKEALGFYEKLLEKNPKDTKALDQLAIIAQKGGDSAEAVKWHKRRMDAAPDNQIRSEAAYTIGVISWTRLYQRSDVPSQERARIADEGLAYLQKALQIRAKYFDALAYANLLYRQRALAHGPSWAQGVETTSAQVYAFQAQAVKKEEAAAAPPAPNPANPPGAPGPK